MLPDDWSDILTDRKNELEDQNLHILSDNSYADDGTGYNTVYDVDYTDEYTHVCDLIEILKKVIF